MTRDTEEPHFCLILIDINSVAPQARSYGVGRGSLQSVDSMAVWPERAGGTGRSGGKQAVQSADHSDSARRPGSAGRGNEGKTAGR